MNRPNQLSLTTWAVVFLGALALLHTTPMVAQETIEDLSQQVDLQLKRSIKTAEERLRLLYSQRNDREVIREAEALLELDSENMTATLLKNRAEARLSRPEDISGSNNVPTAPGATSNRDQGDSSSDPAPGETPTEQPAPPVETTAPAPVDNNQETPAVSSEPVPQPRRSSSSGLNWILIAGIALGIILIIVAIILVVKILRGRKEDEVVQRPSKTLVGLEGVTNYESSKTGVGDMPTLKQNEDETEYHGETEYGATDDFEDDGMEYGEVTEYGEDKTGLADQPTIPEVAPPLEVEPDETSSLALALSDPEEEDNEGGLKLDDLSYSSPKTTESELGIDYSETDSPFSKSQADDVYQTADASFKNTPSEKVGDISGAETQMTPPLDEGESDSVKLDFSSDGFSSDQQTDETMGLDISAPLPPVNTNQPDPDATVPLPPVAKPQEKKEEEVEADEKTIGLDIASAAASGPSGQEVGDDLSFNSLMFGADGEDTKIAPPAAADDDASKKDAEGSDDLTLNTFNQQFTDVMFGSDMEETKMPEGAPAAAPADDGDKTAMLPPIAAAPKANDDLEKTVPIAAPPAAESKPAPAAAGGGRVSMFDKQKTAGLEAMEAGDFARAVQCLSVAASLKPSDKEVRSLLEDARQKRRAS